MSDMKSILAIAVGQTRDLHIVDKVIAGEVRPYIEGLIDGLTKYGRLIGTDYQIDYRERPQLDLKDGHVEAFKAKAAMPYDLIFAMSTTVVRAATNATASIPIVGVVSDLKAEKLHRARNIAGISARRSHTAGEGFECFLATVPTLKQMAVLHKPGYGPSERALKLVKAAAKKRGVGLKPISVKTRQDIEKKLSAMPKRDPKRLASMGLYVLPVDVCLSAAQRIIDLAQGEKHVPVFFPVTDWVTTKPSSALGGRGVSQRRCGEVMADCVNQILWDSAKPSALKIKTLDDDAFEWVVSREAAKALNIKLPHLI